MKVQSPVRASIYLGCVLGLIAAGLMFIAVELLGHVRPAGWEFESAIPAGFTGFVLGLGAGLILFRRKSSDTNFPSIRAQSQKIEVPKK